MLYGDGVEPYGFSFFTEVKISPTMYRHFFKRFIDFWIALVVLICISPLLIVVAIWLHFVNKGAGAFFTQERPGKDAKIFRVIKFKTMTDERGSDGELLPDAQRLTKVGKFVGKLPQIQYRLRNLQTIGVDSTVSVLSQTEFLCKQRYAFLKFGNSFNRLVQVCIGHGVLWCRVLYRVCEEGPNSPCTFNKNGKECKILVGRWNRMALAFSPL